jgi:hypothetical protein
MSHFIQQLEDAMQQLIEQYLSVVLLLVGVPLVLVVACRGPAGISRR